MKTGPIAFLLACALFAAWVLALLGMVVAKGESPLAQYTQRCNALGGVVVEFTEHGGMPRRKACIDQSKIIDVK